MKIFLNNLFFGKGKKTTLTVAVGVLLLVVLGCFGGSSKGTPAPSEYFGEWEGNDGSTVVIRGDGKGDYVSGGSKITGGSVDYNAEEKTIGITVLGFGKTLTIDEAPKDGEMKLSGVVYTKKGGSTSDKKDRNEDKNDDDRGKKIDSSSGEVPSDSDLQSLTKTTLLDFNDAIQKGDFDDFHAKISETWQKEISPERFNQAFKSFIENNVDISEIESMEADFSPKPRITKSRGDDLLKLDGSYDTSPEPTKFELEYIPEDGEWKLTRIRIRTKSYDK